MKTLKKLLYIIMAVAVLAVPVFGVQAAENDIPVTEQSGVSPTSSPVPIRKLFTKGNKIYYYYKGKMVKNKWKRYNGYKYYFGANGYEVVSEDVLPDDRKMLSERMAEIADSGTAELILTTGGTGFSPRDITPEATEDIIDRRVPGIPEAMRAYSMTITKRAMLSRSTAGIRKKTLIINLPGSGKAVTESMEFLIGNIEHGLDILMQTDSECGRA